MTIQTIAESAVGPALDLDAILEELDASYSTLPEEALRTCQRERERVTPLLIEVLQDAVHLGQQGIIRDGNAPLFALFLLAEFQASESLPVVLDFFRLPEFVLDDLLDDTLTQDGDRLLAVLGGHDPDAIESLLADVKVSDYARWQAAAAFRKLVVDGRMSRDEALRRLAVQMRRSMASGDDWGVTIVVDELGYLNPLELQDEIKSAFDQKLVDESIMGWSYFQGRLLRPDQPGACPELDRVEPSAIVDTVDEMRDWYCFSERRRRDDAEYERRQAEERPAERRREAEEEWSRSEWAPISSTTVRNDGPRVGRNESCPCGSWKKYKKCCLRIG